MKITDVRVDGFGVWTGLEVRDLSQNMTVFFGRNEAGKTTLMQFIRTVLYGFSAHRRNRYLPPLHGGVPGGSVWVSTAAGPMELSRQSKLGDTHKSPGEIVIRSEEGAVQGNHQLVAMIGDIDESIFNNVFAVGLRELQELGSLNDTEAADQLYKMTSGMDRVSLVDVMRRLSKSRSQLLGDEEGCEIAELVKQQESLQRELEDLGQGTRRWTSLAAQRTALQREIAQLEQKTEELERESRLIEIARQAKEPWFERVATVRRLEGMGAVAELPMDAIERIGKINELMDRRHNRLDELITQRGLLREEANRLPINRDLWQHASRVEAICEHSQWIASLTNQVDRIRPEVDEFEMELEAQRARLGVSTGISKDGLPEVNAKALASIRSPAKVLGEAKKQLEQAEEERAQYEAELEKTTSRFKRATKERGGTTLAATIADANDAVDLIQKRIQAEERLDQLARQGRELEEDRLDLMDAQILHPHHHLLCAAAVVLGGATFVASLLFFNSLGAMAWLGIIVGAFVFVGGLLYKYVKAQAADDELRDCERQLRTLDDTVKRAKKDRDQVDRELPSGGGSLDRRLADAESHLKSLQDMTPMENELESVERIYDDFERTVDDARRNLKKAEAAWHDTLSRLGLPTSLSPNDIRKLASSFDLIRSTRKQLEVRREELQARERELKAVVSRIAQLMSEVGVTPTDDDPQHRLHQLSAELGTQKKLMDRRSGLKRQFRQCTKEAGRYGRNLRKLSMERAALLDKSGVDDEDALTVLATRFEQFKGLTQDRERLNEQLATMVGAHYAESELAEVFSQHGEARLESAWERITEELTEVQHKTGSLHQELGGVSQEMKALTVDRRPAEIRLDLDAVSHQLRDAVQQWQVLAVSGLLLESTRQIYETERQPETLREASHFLKDLTDGQYRRVWTPLEQDTLMVDDVNGDSLSIDFLSRGTRESVFLSLRLALASAYARRGAMLPLVLDDVLVNLDGRRAKAAVRVLRDFASGDRQLLLFTCHEHIVELFAEQRIEIRELPRHSDIAGLVEPTTPVIEYEYEEEEVEVEAEYELVDFEDEEVEEEAEAEEEEAEAEAEAAEEEEEAEAEEEEAEAEDEEEHEYDEYDERDDEFEKSFTWESPDMWNGASPGEWNEDDEAEGEAA